MNVEVVIPVFQQELSEYEWISLKQCCRILNSYPIILATYKELDISPVLNSLKQQYPVNLKVEYFPRENFSNIEAYNKLLVNIDFYKRFSKADFILIYQTDAFVFKDELKEWCNKGFSYIGAPWFSKLTKADEDSVVIGAGNGGFSLRKVGDHIRALKFITWITRPSALRTLAGRLPGKKDKINSLTNWLFTGRSSDFFGKYANGNEDFFWVNFIGKYVSWFKTAPFEQAKKFSFETNPGKLYKLNDHVLPFGCHAWWRYDLDFWKPYIIRFGYRL